jgi:AcrR family transcriptional regulator
VIWHDVNVSPKVADPAVRDALVEAAARLIAAHKPLTTRRLATEVGTSTMSVYTHFGSMDELRRTVRREGFARLAEHLNRVEPTDDAVADVARQGWAYCLNAIENPNLYRVMFMETAIDEADAEVGLYTFEVLIAAMKRCVEEDRFDHADPDWLATQAWAGIHGAVALYVAGMLDLDTVLRLAFTTARYQFISFGMTPEDVDRSLRDVDFGPLPATV